MQWKGCQNGHRVYSVANLFDCHQQIIPERGKVRARNWTGSQRLRDDNWIVIHVQLSLVTGSRATHFQFADKGLENLPISLHRPAPAGITEDLQATGFCGTYS